MADDQQSVIAATAAVQAVTENANRLGLTWDLRPATVAQIDPVNGITVTVDGDATPITATSMIGTVLPFQRVYVILIPPGGCFIVGYVGNPAGFTPYIVRVFFKTSSPAANFFNLPLLSDIQITYTAKSTSAVTNTNLRLRVNDVISASYNSENIQAVGGGLSSALVDSGATAAFVGSITGASASAAAFGYGNIWFHSPDQTSFPCWTYHNANMVSGGIHDTGGGVMFAAGGPIKSIQLFPEIGVFAAGSVVTFRGHFA